MSYQIRTSIEGKRGCGFRKPGGTYLVCDGPGVICGMLPVVLDHCPCCSAGIKPARGFTWIEAELIQRDCSAPRCLGCGPQGLSTKEKVGLIWVGTGYYPSKAAFLEESKRMGISRRIPALPNGFKIGETWVALAMRDRPTNRMDESGNHILQHQCFAFFRPQRVEYIVKEGDSPEFLQRKADQGYTLIRVIEKKQDLFNPLNLSMGSN